MAKKNNEGHPVNPDSLMSSVTDMDEKSSNTDFSNMDQHFQGVFDTRMGDLGNIQKKVKEVRLAKTSAEARLESALSDKKRILTKEKQMLANLEKLRLELQQATSKIDEAKDWLWKVKLKYVCLVSTTQKNAIYPSDLHVPGARARLDQGKIKRHGYNSREEIGGP